MKAKEYFENIAESTNCKQCEISAHCHYANGTGAVYLDPLCACLNDEDLELDIEELSAKLDLQEDKRIDAIRKEEQRQEDLKKKKQEIQEKRRATLWKNRDINRQKTIERRKQRQEYRLKQFANSMKELGAILKGFN